MFNIYQTGATPSRWQNKGAIKRLPIFIYFPVNTDNAPTLFFRAVYPGDRRKRNPGPKEQDASPCNSHPNNLLPFSTSWSKKPFARLFLFPPQTSLRDIHL